MRDWRRGTVCSIIIGVIIRVVLDKVFILFDYF